jgi:hypothetical protein
MLHNGPVDQFNGTVPLPCTKISLHLYPHQHKFHKDLSNFIVSLKLPDTSYNEAPCFVDASDLVRLEESEVEADEPAAHVFSESQISLNPGSTPLLHQCFGGIDKMPKGQLNAQLLEIMHVMTNKYNVLDPS